MMSAWPGKYVIGLTGNIATGKSVVRKMLEHLGAYGIDADALGHRAFARGAPGYKPVYDTFGQWVMGPDGQVDRSKLARIVFADPDALAKLEAIIHPLVTDAVDILIRRSKHRINVVEAIKLLESPLGGSCDSLWTTYAPPHIQMSRLMKKRGMSEEVARLRIKSQPSQEDKIAAADVVILNDGSFEDTWWQVNAAWLEKIDISVMEPTPPVSVKRGELTAERARPPQAAEIANFINQHGDNRRDLNSDDIMAAFGEKAFLFLRMDDRPVGLAGWQVENLVARTDEVYLNSDVSLKKGMQILLEEIETTSRDLLCEASLLFLPPHLSQQMDVWQTLGYERRTVQSLGVRAWQEAALETISTGETLFFKQLRKDRVLRPV
jgi:dephospho-CoA kinase